MLGLIPLGRRGGGLKCFRYGPHASRHSKPGQAPAQGEIERAGEDRGRVAIEVHQQRVGASVAWVGATRQCLEHAHVIERIEAQSGHRCQNALAAAEIEHVFPASKDGALLPVFAPAHE